MDLLERRSHNSWYRLQYGIMNPATPLEELLFSPQEWGWEPSQVPDLPDCGTLASTFASPFDPYPIQHETSNVVDGGAALNLRGRPSSEKRTFLQLPDWDQLRTQRDPPSGCIHYSIEWEAKVNRKMYWTYTDQDVVLAPSAYFQSILRTQLEDVLRRRRSGNGIMVPTSTDVAVSTTKRGERPLKARFEYLVIQWSIVENQLATWAELFAGTKLLMKLSFNYEDAGQQSRSSWSKRGDKRGPISATNNMLTDLDLQVDAEQVSGEAAIWRHVYMVMRCPGPPCDLGPRCWVDPIGRKHYKLSTHQLKRLVRFVEQGGTLETHDDVPEYIREQLVAEEQQRLHRKRKDPEASSPRLPPITITNVLPGQVEQRSLPVSQSGTATSVQPPRSITASPIDFDLPGCRDDLVREYANDQESKVRDESWKKQVRLARDAALAEGLDLRQLYKERDYTSLEQGGVTMKGVRMRFLDEIPMWIKRRKCELS